MRQSWNLSQQVELREKESESKVKKLEKVKSVNWHSQFKIAPNNATRKFAYEVQVNCPCLSYANSRPLVVVVRFVNRPPASQPDNNNNRARELSLGGLILAGKRRVPFSISNSTTEWSVSRLSSNSPFSPIGEQRDQRR